MTHLTESELIDLAERLEDRANTDAALAPDRAAHANECVDCRRRVDDMRIALSRVVDVNVPEPSPLFWEHFSDRVRDGIRDNRTSAPIAWSDWLQQLRQAGLRWAWSGMLAIVFVMLAMAATWRVMAPAPAPVMHGGPSEADARIASPADSAVEGSEVLDPDADPAWAVVRAVADDLPWNDDVEAGLAARPDAAERAARTLTKDERSELMRLLAAEMKKRKGA